MTQPITPKPTTSARPPVQASSTTRTASAARSSQPSSSERRSGSASRTALLVFLGSLLGSLIGTCASFDDLLNSFGRINQIINPPPSLCVAGSNTILGDGLGLAEDWQTGFEGRVPSKITFDKVGSQLPAGL